MASSGLVELLDEALHPALRVAPRTLGYLLRPSLSRHRLRHATRRRFPPRSRRVAQRRVTQRGQARVSERGRDRMSVVVVTGASGGTALPIPTDVADQEQIDAAARGRPARPRPARARDVAAQRRRRDLPRGLIR